MVLDADIPPCLDEASAVDRDPMSLKVSGTKGSETPGCSRVAIHKIVGSKGIEGPYLCVDLLAAGMAARSVQPYRFISNKIVSHDCDNTHHLKWMNGAIPSCSLARPFERQMVTVSRDQVVTEDNSDRRESLILWPLLQSMGDYCPQALMSEMGHKYLD